MLHLALTVPWQGVGDSADPSPFFGSGARRSFFATPWYGFIDTLRAIDLATIGLFIGRVIYGTHRGWIPKFWRRASWFGICLLLLAVAETEVGKIGYPVGTRGRLWITTIGLQVLSGCGAHYISRTSATIDGIIAEPETWRQAWESSPLRHRAERLLERWRDR